MRKSAPITLWLIISILWGFQVTPAFLMAQSNELGEGVVYYNFAFIERLWQDWSPGW